MCPPLAVAAVIASAVLTGCAVTPYGEATGELDVVAQRQIAADPSAIAACLVRNEQRVAYPSGVSPYATTRAVIGEGMRVEQWFFLRRNAYWNTTFELQPAAGGTEVRVRMPSELTLARGYTRAAAQLIDYCARGKE